MSKVVQLSGSEEYVEYLLRARRLFKQGQAATLKDVYKVYSRTATGIHSDVSKLTPGTLRHSHLTALQTKLDQRAAQLNKSILSAVYRGIWVACSAGSQGTVAVTTQMTEGVFPAAKVEKLFAGINERAILAMLARTRQDGLKLSDRVWRTSESVRTSIGIIVEDAVARGQDSRTTAKQVQQYLKPGVFKSHKLETRRRLGVSTDVSYQAMRLARTEMNNAFHEGTIAVNQHSPGYRGVYWRLSGAHVEPDICTDMAADMSSGEPGFYPKGEEPVRPHPNCMCVVISSWEPLDQYTKRLREWRDNPQLHPDIGAWYNHGDTRQFLGTPIPSTLLIPPTDAIKKKLEAALRKVEDDIAGLKFERIHVLNRGGETIFTKDGTINQIGFTRLDLDTIRAGGSEIVSTHNHPTLGASFSLEDVTLATITDMSEVRVVGRRYLYSMRRPEAGWPPQQLIASEYQIADSMVERTLRKAVRTGRMTAAEAELAHDHAIWERVARELRLDYRREVR